MDVDTMQDLVLNALGPDLAYNELCKALDTDTRRDMLGWIIKCYDLEITEE